MFIEFSKAKSSIYLTELGIVNSVRLKQLEKAYSPKYNKLEGRLIFFNFSQRRKQLLLIYLMLFEIVKFFKLRQLLNKSLLKLNILDGIFILSILVQ